jgi:RNA polymerase sigma-70 factor (ECF subfamily)
LENQLASVSTERHRTSEQGRISAELAEKILSELSPEDRLVLMSIDGEQMPVKDVAEMTGWSQSKVKVRAFRARRRMREAVEKLLQRGRAAVKAGDHV